MPTQNEIEAMVIRILGDSSVFQKAIDQAERAAKNLATTERELTKTEKAREKAMQEGARVTRLVENSTEQYQREVKELNSLLQKGAISQETLNRAVKRAGTEYVQAGSSLKALGEGVQRVGRRMTLGVTAPLVGIGILTAKVGSDLDSAFIGIEKTVDGTKVQLRAVRSELQALGTTGGIAVDFGKMFNVAELGGQLGIARSNIGEFTKTIVDMDVSTNLAADEAGTALARIANITGLSQKKFANLGSSIVALGNTTATTERDIVAMTLRLSGAGIQVGLTVPQITALAASLSSVGIEAESGGTAFSQLFIRISKAVSSGGKTLQEFSRVARMSVEEFSETFRKDAAGAIIELLAGLKSLDSASGLQSLDAMGIKGIRLTDALLRSSKAVDLMRDAMVESEEAFKEGTALAEEAAKRYASFKSQLILLRNEIAVVASQLFDEMRPTLTAIIASVKSAVKWFGELPPSVKAVAVVMGVVVAAVGPLLIIFGSLAVTIAQLTLSFKTYSILNATLGGSLKATSASTAVLNKLLIGNSVAAATASKAHITLATSVVGTSSSIIRSNAVVGTSSVALSTTMTVVSASIVQSYLRIGLAAVASSKMVVASSAASSAALLGMSATANTAASTAPLAFLGMAGNQSSKAAAQVASSGKVIDATFTQVSSKSTTTSTKIFTVAGASSLFSKTLGRLGTSLKAVIPLLGKAVAVTGGPLVATLGIASIALVSVAGEGDTLAEKLSASMTIVKNLFSEVWYRAVIPALDAAKIAMNAIKETIVGAGVIIGGGIKDLAKTFIGWGESIAVVVTGNEKLHGVILDNLKAVHDLNKQLELGSKLSSDIITGNDSRFTEQLDLAVKAGGEDELENLRNRVDLNLQGISDQVREKGQEIEKMGGGPFRKFAENELESLTARESQLRKHLAQVDQAMKAASVKAVPEEDQSPSGGAGGGGLVIDQKGIDKTLAEVEAKLEAFGQEPILLKLGLAGAAEAEIAKVKDLLHQLSAKEATADVEKFTKSLQEQAATISMTTDEARLYAFELKNLANPEAIDRAKKALSELEKAGDAKKMRERGEKLMEEFASPMQKFKDKKKELKNLLDAGAIDEKLFKTAMAAAKSDLEKLQEQADKGITVDFKSKGIQAIEKHSAESLARILEHQDMLSNLGKRTEKNTERQQENLAGSSIAAKVSPQLATQIAKVAPGIQEIDQVVNAANIPAIPDGAQRISQIGSGIASIPDAVQNIAQVINPSDVSRIPDQTQEISRTLRTRRVQQTLEEFTSDPRRVPLTAPVSLGAKTNSLKKELGLVDPSGPIAFRGGRSDGFERRQAIAKQRTDARKDQQAAIQEAARVANRAKRQDVVQQRQRAIQGIIDAERLDSGNTISQRAAAKRLANRGGVASSRQELSDANFLQTVDLEGLAEEEARARAGREFSESSSLVESSRVGSSVTAIEDKKVSLLERLVELQEISNDTAVQLVEAGF